MEYTTQCEHCLATVTHILPGGVKIPTVAEDPDFDLCTGCIDERDAEIEEAAAQEEAA